MHQSFDALDDYSLLEVLHNLFPQSAPISEPYPVSRQEARRLRRQLHRRRQDHGSAAARLGHLLKDRGWSDEASQTREQHLRRTRPSLSCVEEPTEESPWFWEDTTGYEEPISNPDIILDELWDQAEQLAAKANVSARRAFKFIIGQTSMRDLCDEDPGDKPPASVWPPCVNDLSEVGSRGGLRVFIP